MDISKRDPRVVKFISDVFFHGWRDAQSGRLKREEEYLRSAINVYYLHLISIFKQKAKDIVLSVNVKTEFLRFITSLYSFGKKSYNGLGRQIATEKICEDYRLKIINVFYPELMSFKKTYCYYQKVNSFSLITDKINYFSNDANYHSDFELEIIKLIEDDLSVFGVSGSEYYRLKQKCLGIRGIIFKTPQERAKEVGEIIS